MTTRPSRPTLIVLLAVLLSGLACSLFRSEPPLQPATATPTQIGPAATATPIVVPATRPADFTVTYAWREATLAPPYHYEYTIAVAADGTLTMTFIPDYPGPGVPTWTETVRLDAAQMDALYATLTANGLFTTKWQVTDGPPVGGSSYDLTATAAGITVEVPSYVVDDQDAAADALSATLNALIPPAMWDDLNAQRTQYIAEHSE
jgi:hypothetical protein